MGYVELANEKLKAQVDGFSKLAADKMALSVPTIPQVPTIPGLSIPGLESPTVLSCTPSFQSIAAALPPLPPSLTPEAIIKDKIAPIIKDLPGLPSILKIPSIDSLKRMIPNIPGIPTISLTENEQAVLEKIKGVLPGLPGIQDIPQPPSLEDLKTFAATGMGAGQAALDAVTIQDLIPIISSRFGAYLTPPDPYTLENVTAFAKGLLPSLPELPSLSSIPGVAELKTICTPPVEEPSANTVLPIDGTNEMDKNGVNLKAQVAIIGEAERQKKVQVWIGTLENKISSVSSIQTKLESLIILIKSISDVSTHPQTEDEWKAKFELIKTNFDEIVDLLVQEVEFCNNLARECINSETNEPFENLKAHYNLFKDSYIRLNNSVLLFYKEFVHPIMDNVEVAVDKINYAIWELYGTELSIEGFARRVYTNALEEYTFVSFVKPYEKYNITTDKLRKYYLNVLLKYQMMIESFQDSLPKKG